MVTMMASALHKTLELVFEHQGFAAARHFLDANSVAEGLESRPIIDILEAQLSLKELPKDGAAEILTVAKAVLAGIFYASSQIERQYCARLARTYILLFTIRNTPEIIEYFNTMSKEFNLYVGSDLIIRGISEYYLRADDQMTVNALKIIKQAGSRIILSEAMLEEVHSHINASNREYVNHYLEIDSIVDHALASQSDRILIRAYYYAKLDKNLYPRPMNWAQFLNNFLTASKLTAATSPESMKSLRDTLCQRFGLEFEPRSVTAKEISEKDTSKLAKKITEMRRYGNKELLATNDAQLILRVEAIRRHKEAQPGNPYGYKTWYLTQDTVSNVAASIC